jgi:isopenicillin-N N-acyltransferase-like protein
MNAAGIAQSSNSQGHLDFKEEGVPCVFVARKVLSARTIDEAVSYATMEDRATGTNHLIVDDKGAMYSIETSAMEHSIIKNRKYAIHSNHYVTARMQKYTEEEDKDSLNRYGLAKDLVSKTLKRINLDALKKILSSHGYGDAMQPDPYALCQHMTRAYSPMDEDETIASAIFNLTTKTAYICKGTPCNGVFKEHRLESAEAKQADEKEEPKPEARKDEPKAEEKKEEKK